MELKFWFYIIVGIIYLVVKLRKKSGQSPVETTSYEQAQPTVRPATQTITTKKAKGLTFEELLKEIAEEKAPKQTYKPAPRPTYDEYEVVEKGNKSLEKIPYDYHKKDNIYNIYEDAKTQAFARPSLEETMKLKDTDVTFGRFKIFEDDVQQNVSEQYAKDFSDPEGFKRAFVMSEIMKPKF